MKIDYGPLRSLFESDDISEIMVNAWNKVFVEHKGQLMETGARFVDDRQYQEFIYAILSEDKKVLGTALSFDGVLPSGYRYNLTFPPLSPKGPALTIRKFNVKNFSLEDLAANDFLSEAAAHFLQNSIIGKLNIVISGGTGSGKTSFLNSLASLIPGNERVVTIEDTAELRFEHQNWLALQAVNDPKNPVTVRQCFTTSLRMRPNRIIVGECRKDETFEMLQAMNTGHDGSMTTIHANSTHDCLSRMESLISFAGLELPLKQIRNQMSKAIDLVIQVRRHSNGKREVTEIIEVSGLSEDVIQRSAIFQRDKQGRLAATGYVPRCLEKINADKMLLHPSFFATGAHLFPMKKAA